jgi:hypothetical protein
MDLVFVACLSMISLARELVHARDDDFRIFPLGDFHAGAYKYERCASYSCVARL